VNVRPGIQPGITGRLFPEQGTAFQTSQRAPRDGVLAHGAGAAHTHLPPSQRFALPSVAALGRLATGIRLPSISVTIVLAARPGLRSIGGYGLPWWKSAAECLGTHPEAIVLRKPLRRPGKRFLAQSRSAPRSFNE